MSSLLAEYFKLRDLHDENGNAEHLLSAEDKKSLDEGTWNRASGDVICPTCNKDYYHHPHVMGALWLRRICNGNLVKL